MPTNLQTNPGFESAGSHSYFDNAARVASNPRNGTYSLKLNTTSSGFGGPTTSRCDRATFPVTADEVYRVSFWANPDNVVSGTVPLEVRLSKGFPGLFQVVDSIDPTSVGPGYVQFTYLFRALATATGQLRLDSGSPDPPGLVNDDWHVDDVQVFDAAEIDVAKWEAINGVITALKGVNGSGGGYNLDVNNRVYTRELWPDRAPDVKRPYITVTELPASFTDQETWLDETLRLMIQGFVTDAASSVRDSSSVQQVSLLHDDIIKALRADQTFGGTVRELTINSIDTPPPTDGWQGVEFDVSIRLIYQDSDLGA